MHQMLLESDAIEMAGECIPIPLRTSDRKRLHSEQGGPVRGGNRSSRQTLRPGTANQQAILASKFRTEEHGGVGIGVVVFEIGRTQRNFRSAAAPSLIFKLAGSYADGIVEIR